MANLFSRRQFHTLLSGGLFGLISNASHSESRLAASEGGSNVSRVTHEQTFGLLSDPGKKIPVIFDTDIGSDIDDTWALLYLLKCPELDVRLIATDSSSGNYRTRLTAKFLQAIGRTDIPISKSIGHHQGLGHQQDWVKGFELDQYAGTVYDDSADAIIKTIHGSPDPVTLICVGTVPNIAEALRRDPTICGNARFVGMHGSIHQGYGGSDTPSAESNVKYGVDALQRTFAADWQCSITPLDTCGQLTLVGDRYQRVFQSNAVGVAELMQNYRDWLTRVDWLKTKPNPSIASTTLFDMVAVTMAFTERWLEMETLPLAVTEDGFTRIDEQNGVPVRCALRWEKYEDYLDHLVERLTAQ